jgi:hypothetical protein
MTRTFTLTVILAALLGGCAPQSVWVKPGAGAQDFNVDQYACEKDARQSGYFGSGIIGSINMQDFYNRCMIAHGWHTERKATNVSYGSALPPGQTDKLGSCQVPGRPHPEQYLRSVCLQHDGTFLD